MDKECISISLLCDRCPCSRQIGSECETGEARSIDAIVNTERDHYCGTFQEYRTIGCDVCVCVWAGGWMSEFRSCFRTIERF